MAAVSADLRTGMYPVACENVTVFSGDVALRTFAGHRLFPMAAPTGGIVLIAAWLGLAAAAVGALLRS